MVQRKLGTPQSAVTGKFVTKAYAKSHPNTTFTEARKTTAPKKKK